MKRSIRTAAGLVLLVLGVAGLVLPILPGIPIMMAGLAILGTDHPVRVALGRRLQRWGVGKASPEEPPDENRR